MEAKTFQRFFHELRRRKVVRVAIVYAIVAWVLMQVAEVTFEPLNLPEWARTLVVVIAILGFPIAVVMAWALEMTPGGVRREPEAVAESAAEPSEEAATPAPVSAEPSIAVLPFADMSPDKDQDYFCEGMAEEILNALVRIEGLRVAARTSSFQFKDKAVDARAVGKQLGVSAILEGSVRKANSQLRVTAQLIDTADGYHLWSERYDRQLEDVFAIQEEIAGNIVQALKKKLTAGDREAIHAKSPKQVQAYEHYLRGRQFANRLDQRHLEFAVQMFRRAIGIDHEYAPAYAGLADAHSLLYLYVDASEENCRRACRASEMAVELDPESAVAQASLALAKSLEKDYVGAELAFERAIELNPNLFEPYYFYARTCYSQGKYEQAAALYEKAAEVRPEDYQTANLLIQVYEGLDQPEKAKRATERGIERAQRALDLNPDDTRALYFVGGALIRLGEREKGLEMAERALAIDPNDGVILYNVACVNSVGGEYERALDLLERVDFPGMANKTWIEHDSDLDPLRDHPRFKALLAKAR